MELQPEPNRLNASRGSSERMRMSHLNGAEQIVGDQPLLAVVAEQLGACHQNMRQRCHQIFAAAWP